MRRRLLPFLLLAPSLWGQELVVIVHPESGVQQLSREAVTSLFMGRQKRLTRELLALPVEQFQPPGVRERFYRLLVGKRVAEINAYWARLYFSGQSQPPHRGQSAQDVVDMVAANKGAVGFVERSRVDRRVRVVLTLGGK